MYSSITFYVRFSHCNSSKHLYARGLTLLELLISLSVFSILTATALPGFSHLIQTTQTRTNAHRLYQNIQYARNTALAEHKVVTLCPSNDGIICAGSNWQPGGLIFEDKNKNGIRDTHEKLLKIISPFQKNSYIAWRAFRNKNYLSFNGRGVTEYQNGNFTYCPPNKNLKYAAQIIVSYSGRPRYARDQDGDGIINGTNGKNVSC